jgi:hypothetical protein
VDYRQWDAARKRRPTHIHSRQPVRPLCHHGTRGEGGRRGRTSSFCAAARSSAAVLARSSRSTCSVFRASSLRSRASPPPSPQRYSIVRIVRVTWNNITLTGCYVGGGSTQREGGRTRKGKPSLPQQKKGPAAAPAPAAPGRRSFRAAGAVTGAWNRLSAARGIPACLARAADPSVFRRARHSGWTARWMGRSLRMVCSPLCRASTPACGRWSWTCLTPLWTWCRGSAPSAWTSWRRWR